MRIAIAVEGTRGDVHPMLALAGRLGERGHQVAVCAPPDFAADAAELGLAFHPVGASVREYLESQSAFLHGNAWESVNAGRRYFRDTLVRQFAELTPVARGADWVLSAGVQLSAPSVAEAVGARHRFIAYCPSLLRSPHQTPFAIPRASLRPWQNRLAWWGTLKLMGTLRGVLDTERKRAGLQPSPPDLYTSFTGEGPLLAAEELLAPPPEDLRVPVIGCLHPFAPGPLPEKLDAFLRAGPPPVYLGFGSMTDPDPAAGTRLVLEAIERAGVRAVLSAGWAGLGDGPLPPHVHVVGTVSHAALFARVALVVHHGGAGTTTTAARAGAPQILVPHILDQFHWAGRIQRLGLGPGALPRRGLDAQRLAEVLRATLDNEMVQQNAAALGARLRDAARARARIPPRRCSARLRAMLDRLLLTARLLPALPKLSAHKPDGRTTVADLIEAQARRRPAHPFVLYQDREQSYGELNRFANQVAHWAISQGLIRGDVVALCLENRPEYVACWAGLAKLGVTAALINTHLTGRALAHALATSGARQLVVGEECLASLAAALPDLERPPSVWVLRDPETRDAVWPDPAHDLDDELTKQAQENPDPALRAGLRAGDELFYIYTSGTTGLPKAARFSHMRFLGMGDLSAFALKLRPDDVHYCALPLYHSAGGAMLVSSVLSAGCVMALRRRFSASRFWDDIRRYEASCFQYIGELCRYLVQQPPRADDRDHGLRAMIGNGMRADVWQAFQERFQVPMVREFYGATEGNVALMNFEDRVGSVGRMPFKALTNARIVRYDVEADAPVRGADGLCIECAPDEVGELVGRIPNEANAPAGRFEGYTSKEATERKVLRDVLAPGDAWFRSGDLLRQDRDGFFYFIDRIGDTFRWKGENVSTQEVAEQLAGFPDVLLANVYGVEIPGTDGRAGMAALLLARGSAFDGAAFFRHVQGLPRYAAPLFVRLLAEQETTGTFKIRKVELQRQGFDPAAIADALYLRDDAAGSYVPLTPERAAAIRSGARTL